MCARLGKDEPDPDGTHWRAMCAAGEALCHRFAIHEAELLICAPLWASSHRLTGHTTHALATHAVAPRA